MSTTKMLKIEDRLFPRDDNIFFQHITCRHFFRSFEKRRATKVLSTIGSSMITLQANKKRACIVPDKKIIIRSDK